MAMQQDFSPAPASSLKVERTYFWHSLLRPLSPAAWREDIKATSGLTHKQVGKNLLKLIPLACLCYLLLTPLVAMPLYNLVLFHPLKPCPEINSNQIEKVRFAGSNGKTLAGWYFYNPTAKYTVLVSHGNGGNISHRLMLADFYLKSGVSVFMYDYQGYGDSAGSPSLENICADGLAAYHYLRKEKKIEAKNIILLGESLGSGVAAQLASKNPCAGLILQSAYTSIPAVGKQKFLWLNLYPNFLFPEQSLNSETALKQIKTPVLIVHGVQDRLIPVSESDKLAAAANHPKQLVKLPNASHNDIYDVDKDLYRTALTQFINSLDIARH